MDNLDLNSPLNIDINLDIEENIDLPFLYDDLISMSKIFTSFALFKNFASDKFISKNMKDYFYSFDLMFCNNEFIHKINFEYRNINSPTDVITFALYSDSENSLIVDNTINLGQIIISVEQADIQAKEYESSLNEEILNLLSHGILHLLGVDHTDENSLNKMLKMQQMMIKVVQNV